MSLQHEVILVAILFFVFATLSFIARGQRLLLTRRLRKRRRHRKPIESDGIENQDAPSSNADWPEDSDDPDVEVSPQAEVKNRRTLNITLVIIALSLALGAYVAFWAQNTSS